MCKTSLFVRCGYAILGDCGIGWIPTSDLLVKRTQLCDTVPVLFMSMIKAVLSTASIQALKQSSWCTAEELQMSEDGRDQLAEPDENNIN